MAKNDDEKKLEKLNEDRESYERLKDFQKISSYISEPFRKFLGRNF